MRKILFLYLLTSFIFTGSLFAEGKPRITVYGFESKASSGVWHDAKWDIGTGMGEMLIDALVATGKFEVLERLNVEDITFEQDLVKAGRVAQKSGAKTGKMKGAEYIVRGTITEFDMRETGGGFGVDIKGISLGASGQEAHIAGVIRIYDATTGEIYASQRVARSVPAGGLTVGYNRGDIGVNLGGFKKTPLGEATQLAINDMVGFISEKIPEVSGTAKMECPFCSTEITTQDKFCPKCGKEIPEKVITSCPWCKTDVEPGTKFCEQCGKPLTEMQCPKCKTKIAPGAKFCPNCGAPAGAK
jgi:curli biogenesis system outer membrane secretion channel CsgG